MTTLTPRQDHAPTPSPQSYAKFHEQLRQSLSRSLTVKVMEANKQEASPDLKRTIQMLEENLKKSSEGVEQLRQLRTGLTATLKDVAEDTTARLRELENKTAELKTEMKSDLEKTAAKYKHEMHLLWMAQQSTHEAVRLLKEKEDEEDRKEKANTPSSSS